MFSVFLEEGANPATTPELCVARPVSDLMLVCWGMQRRAGLFLGLLLAEGVNVNEAPSACALLSWAAPSKWLFLSLSSGLRLCLQKSPFKS